MNALEGLRARVRLEPPDDPGGLGVRHPGSGVVGEVPLLRRDLPGALGDLAHPLRAALQGLDPPVEADGLAGGGLDATSAVGDLRQLRLERLDFLQHRVPAGLRALQQDARPRQLGVPLRRMLRHGVQAGLVHGHLAGRQVALDRALGAAAEAVDPVDGAPVAQLLRLGEVVRLVDLAAGLLDLLHHLFRAGLRVDDQPLEVLRDGLVRGPEPAAVVRGLARLRRDGVGVHRPLAAEQGRQPAQRLRWRLLDLRALAQLRRVLGAWSGLLGPGRFTWNSRALLARKGLHLARHRTGSGPGRLSGRIGTDYGVRLVRVRIGLLGPLRGGFGLGLDGVRIGPDWSGFVRLERLALALGDLRRRQLARQGDDARGALLLALAAAVRLDRADQGFVTLLQLEAGEFLDHPFVLALQLAGDAVDLGQLALVPRLDLPANRGRHRGQEHPGQEPAGPRLDHALHQFPVLVAGVLRDRVPQRLLEGLLPPLLDALDQHVPDDVPGCDVDPVQHAGDRYGFCKADPAVQRVGEPEVRP
ncbi:MAG: hypothetical protein B7733_06315 [Myxococcales bacterium FL481]|nr:MAG: hypothetical protein B7733_06315 [Myxococcales bacterium FL481]